MKANLSKMYIMRKLKTRLTLLSAALLAASINATTLDLEGSQNAPNSDESQTFPETVQNGPSSGGSQDVSTESTGSTTTTIESLAGKNALYLGENAIALGENGIAYGTDAINTSNNGVSFGTNAISTGKNLSRDEFNAAFERYKSLIAQREDLIKQGTDNTATIETLTSEINTLQNTINAKTQEIADQQKVVANLEAVMSETFGYEFYKSIQSISTEKDNGADAQATALKTVLTERVGEEKANLFTEEQYKSVINKYVEANTSQAEQLDSKIGTSDIYKSTEFAWGDKDIALKDFVILYAYSQQGDTTLNAVSMVDNAVSTQKTEAAGWFNEGYINLLKRDVTDVSTTTYNAISQYLKANENNSTVLNQAIFGTEVDPTLSAEGDTLQWTLAGGTNTKGVYGVRRTDGVSDFTNTTNNVDKYTDKTYRQFAGNVDFSLVNFTDLSQNKFYNPETSDSRTIFLETSLKDGDNTKFLNVYQFINSIVAKGDENNLTNGQYNPLLSLTTTTSATSSTDVVNIGLADMLWYKDKVDNYVQAYESIVNYTDPNYAFVDDVDAVKATLQPYYNEYKTAQTLLDKFFEVYEWDSNNNVYKEKSGDVSTQKAEYNALLTAYLDTNHLTSLEALKNQNLLKTSNTSDEAIKYSQYILTQISALNQDYVNTLLSYDKEPILESIETVISKEAELVAEKQKLTNLQTELNNANLSKEEKERLLAEARNSSDNIDNLLAEIEEANPQGKNSTAIGNKSFASGENSTAVGYYNTVTGDNSTAIGSMNTVTGDSSTAVGYSNTVTGDYSSAFGTLNVVTGNYAHAVGYGNAVLADKSTAIGNNNVVEGEQSLAMGNDNVVKGNENYAIGNRNQLLEGENNFVFGSDVIIDKSLNGNVVLGHQSTLSEAAPTPRGEIAGQVYEYAGGNPTSVVSVGSEGNERQIQNVAAGRVSPTSTDAINGSQLYATHKAIEAVDHRVNILDKRIDEIDDKYSSGMAAANALSGLVQVTEPGKRLVTASVGNYRDKQAIAVGVSGMTDNSRWIYKVGAGTNLQGKQRFNAHASIGFQW